MNTGPERKTASARAACAPVSATTSLTRTLVSTAPTPSLHALRDRPFHVWQNAAARHNGHTYDIVQARHGKRPHRTQQNPFGDPFGRIPGLECFAPAVQQEEQ